VADAHGASSSAGAGVTVNNAAPAIVSLTNSGLEIGDAGEKVSVTVSGSFTDAGTADQHAVSINWATAP